MDSLTGMDSAAGRSGIDRRSIEDSLEVDRGRSGSIGGRSGSIGGRSGAELGSIGARTGVDRVPNGGRSGRRRRLRYP